MAAKVSLTKKQRECAHTPAHVRPTIDPRYEQCHACGIIRVAPIAAPWIIAYDEAQPEPAPPPLFAGYDPAHDPYSPAYAAAAEEAAGDVEPWELADDDEQPEEPEAEWRHWLTDTRD